MTSHHKLKLQSVTLKTSTFTLLQRQLVRNFADGTMRVDIEKTNNFALH